MPFPPLPAPLADALAARGYAEPTGVQAAVLAPETIGRDLLVSARTGSGKTVAFGLAAAPQILDEAGSAGVPGLPKALVVAPTRELAMQVQRELAWLYSRARVLACVGGMDPRREARLMHDGVHIVVGTPGRLCDHVDRGNLSLENVSVLVLDEADEMLDLGFRDELEQLLVATPKDRRTLLFSATVPTGIEQIASRYQRDALRIAVQTGEAHADIDYRAVLTIPREREHAVVNVLRFIDSPGALVFCHTREGVNHLHGNLLERGFSVVALSGELTQAERNRAMGALRDGRARVCVATDVAARGIDLPDLGLVIHADMPKAAETLLHRSGRTGRAGKKGLAAVIVPMNRQRFAERLFQDARVNPRWMGPPPPEQIRQRDDARLAESIKAQAAEVSDEDRVLAKSILEGADPEALVATLVRSHRAALPEPEEVTIWSPREPVRREPPRPPPAPPVARPPTPPAVPTSANPTPAIRPPAPPAAPQAASSPVARPPAPPAAPTPVFVAAPASGAAAAAPAKPTAKPTKGAQRQAESAAAAAAATEGAPASGDVPVIAVPKSVVKKPHRTGIPLEGGAAPVRRPAPAGVWFRVNVGHHQRADPKWLVPMLCRRGNIDKADLCAFRVFAHETRVLVRTEVAERFFEQASLPDRLDPRVRILPA